MLRRTITLTIILVLIFALYNLARQISGALQAGNRLDQAVDQLSSLQQKNHQLNDQLSQVQSQEYIEKIARDELNYSKPNETVAIIPQDEIDKVLGAEKKPEEVELPNWQGWLKLIFH